MSSTQESKTATPSNAPRGDKRRKRILRALHDCIIDKGYAKTTLADIAKIAEMYPSHLLYYFEGKDAILEYYFKNVSEKILERLESHHDKSSEEQIDLLTELFFAGKGITISEIGFMLECFGVAVHHSELHREKAALDDRCKAYITKLFENTPRKGVISGPKDTAEIAYAMLIGLRTAVYFDKNLELPAAHRLFRNTMLTLAGLEQTS
ncbi:MAG: TetR/AcrR family transcriptional regulator [Gammaproteobacteria bacterium]|jgi:AcrR family transcriptional regulator|nr:TetR/AcrR family transcriptional regulator [Gammaproteobacteria bacterium]